MRTCAFLKTFFFFFFSPFLLTFSRNWLTLIGTGYACLCVMKINGSTLHAALLQSFQPRYTTTVWALCMVHKNSTWSCLKAQISEKVLALTRDSEGCGCWSGWYFLCAAEVWGVCFVAGENRLLFSEILSVECHKMVSGTGFPFAFSLFCLQGLRTEHSAKRSL